MLTHLMLLPIALIAPQPGQNPDYMGTSKEFINTYLNRTKNAQGSYQRTSSWFTPELNQLMLDYIKTREKDIKEHPKEMPNPSIEEKISIFWDLPSKVSTSSVKELGDSAVVILLCAWGKGTDYEGDKQPVSLIFKRSSGSWKIDNITSPKGKFVPQVDLRSEFSEKR